MINGWDCLFFSVGFECFWLGGWLGFGEFLAMLSCSLSLLSILRFGGCLSLLQNRPPVVERYRDLRTNVLLGFDQVCSDVESLRLCRFNRQDTNVPNASLQQNPSPYFRNHAQTNIFHSAASTPPALPLLSPERPPLEDRSLLNRSCASNKSLCSRACVALISSSDGFVGPAGPEGPPVVVVVVVGGGAIVDKDCVRG